MLLLKLLEIFCSLLHDHCLVVVATLRFHLFPCCCYSEVPSLSLLLLLSGSISFLVAATQWFHLFPCCCYSVVPSLSLLLLLSDLLLTSSIKKNIISARQIFLKSFCWPPCVPPYSYCNFHLLLPGSMQCVEYGSERGGVWNMALELMCVEYGSESGGVWNMALRVEVCGIWL